MEVAATNRPLSLRPPRPADAGRISREPPGGQPDPSAKHFPEPNKTMNHSTTADHPTVSKIRIEYADGSHDEMELIDPSQVLYSWDRKRPTEKSTRGGLYTANRIGALLFKTGLEGRLAEDQLIFKKQANLLKTYLKD